MNESNQNTPEKTDEELSAYLASLSNTLPTEDSSIEEVTTPPDETSDTTNTPIEATEGEDSDNVDSGNVKEVDATIDSDTNTSIDGSDIEKVTDTLQDANETPDFTEALKNIGVTSLEKLDELNNAFKLNKLKSKQYSQFDEQLHIVKEAKLSATDLALATEALQGNPEAIKKIMKLKELDPVDFITDDEDEEPTIDESKYKVKSEEKLFNDALLVAESRGVSDNFMNAFNSWDEGSLNDMMSNKNNVDLFIKELSDGSFDEIQTIINEQESQDFNGSFGEKDSLDKYIYAQQIYKDRHKPIEPKVQVNDAEPTSSKEEVQKVVVNNNNTQKLNEAKLASEQRTVSNSNTTNSEQTNKAYSSVSDEEFFKMFDEKYK